MERLVEIGMSFLTKIGMVPALYTALAMVGGLLVLVYLYEPYWKVRRIPGPPIIPLVGHLPLMARHGHDVFSILAKRYGPIFRLHVGRQPLVIIADAELCREVGIKKFKEITNRSVPYSVAVSSLHVNGLFFAKDAKWSTMRNTITSIYQPSHLANLAPAMEGFIKTAFQNLPTSGEEDIPFSNLSLKLTTDVLGQAAFGVDFGQSKPPSDHEEVKKTEESDFIDEYIDAAANLKLDFSGSFSGILGLLFPVLQKPVHGILSRIPGTMDWKNEQTSMKLSRKLDGIVMKRMKNKDRGCKDFLSLILNAMESEKTTKNFSMEFLSATAYEHLLAGTATTSFTLSSTVYLIADYPEVEKKLLEEIDRFGPPDRIPTPDDLQTKFPYLEQVVKEALRFHSFAPLLGRETSTQVEVGGYVLPKGTWIWMAPGVLSKDPKNFPGPEKFRPERFDPDCEEEKQRHPYAWIPFGIGPRACLGVKFAWQELKLTLIHLYQNYVFRHSPSMERPLEFEYDFLLSFKHGVKLRAIKRKVENHEI